MRWNQGRAEIDATLSSGELQRVPARGGHVYRSVHAQLDPPLGTVLRSFDRMRRRRNGLEYPDFEAPALTAVDVEEDLRRAEAIVELAMRTLDQMSPY